MAQTLGIIDLYWNGRRLDTEKGASFRLPGYKNNPVMAGRRGFRAQEYQMGEAKGVLVLKAGDAATDLLPGAEGELQVVCDTGQTYTASDAFILDPPTWTGGDGGKGELTWNFNTYEELLA